MFEKEDLKIAFATSYAFYQKALGYHWNVVGRNFYSDHLLLEKIYTDVYGYIDKFAEIIRSTGEVVPSTFDRLETLSLIKNDNRVLTADAMIFNLNVVNHVLIGNLTTLIPTVEDSDIQNFLQDVLYLHNKIKWMLDSTEQP